MFEMFFFFVVFIIITAICLHNHHMSSTVAALSTKDKKLVRSAAESSILASNTVNPIISLVEVVKAVEKIECLQERYGVSMADQITGVNTNQILDVVLKQKKKILQDVMNINKKYHPQRHPLNSVAGYTS